MTLSAARKITRDVQDVAGDIKHAVVKAAPRIRESGEDMVVEAAQRLGLAARDVASEAAGRSRTFAKRAAREAKARPVVAGAILAGAAALIGLAFVRRPRKTP